MAPMTSRDRSRQWATRQQLLATLDKQIKSNPYYRQNNAVGQYDQRKSASNYPLYNSRDQADGNDVDTYSSFHSESDPYKSFTTSSRIVSEPAMMDSSVQSGGNQRLPTNQVNINANGNGYITKKINPKSDQADDGNSGQTRSNQMSVNPTVGQSRSKDLLTGTVMNLDSNLRQQLGTVGDLLRSNKVDNLHPGNLRVRRDGSDERESDDVDGDDDGVWVDDDEDDDSRQQSSDVNETAQDPDDENNNGDYQQDVGSHNGSLDGTSGIRTSPHGYELSPDDLMVYPG